MFLNKIKLGAAAVLSAGLAVALVNGSLSTVSLAQDTKATPAKEAAAATTESDADFIRRISKDLRGCAPTPAEVHFFAASKDAGKRQKLIDLFIQERQAKKDAQARADAAKPWLTGTIPVTNTPFVNQPFIIHDGTVRFANQPFLLSQNTLTPFHGTITSSGTLFTIHSAAASPKLGTLQSEFYKGLFTAKEKSDVARITQTYLDRLSQYVKDNPKNEDVADAMLQILRVYESQSKTVEAGAWRDKLRKEHPKSAAAKSLTGG